MSEVTWQKQLRQAGKDFQTTVRVYVLVAQAIFYIVCGSYLFGTWNVFKILAYVLVAGTLLGSVLYMIHTLIILLLSTVSSGISSGLSKVKDITVAGVSSIVDILLSDWRITLVVVVSVGTSILITKYIYDNAMKKGEEINPDSIPKQTGGTSTDGLNSTIYSS